MSDLTTNLSIPLLFSNQAQKEITINEALCALDAWLNRGAVDKDLASPPASPNAGDIYLIPAGATGVWAGHDGQMAYFDQVWRFVAPREGMTLWVNDEDILYAFDGASWVKAGASTSAPQFGVNASADSTNRLTVASDAVLLNHNGHGSQVKVNKASAGDTASHLFQTDFSGRAEFGLTGDDDFHVKVSPNGTIWHDSLSIDRADGVLNVKKRLDAEAGLSFDGGTNVLSAYESGTFTPVYQAASGSPSITYLTQTGHYTRIGRVVFVFIRLGTSAFTAAGAVAMRIAGLPFAAQNISPSGFPLTIAYANDFGATNTPVGAFVAGGTSYVTLLKHASADARSEISQTFIETDMGTSTSDNEIILGGYYFG